MKIKKITFLMPITSVEAPILRIWIMDQIMKECTCNKCYNLFKSRSLLIITLFLKSMIMWKKISVKCSRPATPRCSSLVLSNSMEQIILEVLDTQIWIQTNIMHYSLTSSIKQLIIKNLFLTFHLRRFKKNNQLDKVHQKLQTPIKMTSYWA